MALNTAFVAGVLPREGTPNTNEIRLKSSKEVAEMATAGREDIDERGWGGHKATAGTLGRKLLGWEPRCGQEAWKGDFDGEMKALREGKRGLTMDACLGMT